MIELSFSEGLEAGKSDKEAGERAEYFSEGEEVFIRNHLGGCRKVKEDNLEFALGYIEGFESE